MPGFFYVLIGSALGLALLAAGLASLLVRRLRVALSAATAAERQAEVCDRCLGMVAHELQTSGFALLSLPGPAAAAAQRLLAVADDVSDSLAAEAAPRRLSQDAVPLSPLLEEAVAGIRANGAGGRPPCLARCAAPGARPGCADDPARRMDRPAPGPDP